MKTIALPLFLAFALVIPHASHASEDESPTTSAKQQQPIPPLAAVILYAMHALLEGDPETVQNKGMTLGMTGLAIATAGLYANSPAIIAISLVALAYPGAGAYFVGYLRNPENIETASKIVKFLKMPEAISAIAASHAASQVRNAKNEENPAQSLQPA